MGLFQRKPCFLARFLFIKLFNLFVLFFCKERQLSFTGVVKKICFKKNRFVIFGSVNSSEENSVFYGLFSIYSIFAKDPPPAPTYRKPPPPPHLSIDENIFIVVLIALLFGIYIIYNNRLKTKPQFDWGVCFFRKDVIFIG